MRWDALFADLEAQLGAADGIERAGEVAERARAEAGRLRLTDRLRAALGTPVRIELADLELRGRLVKLAPEWLLLAEDDGGEALISVGAVQVVHGLSRLSSTSVPSSVVAARLGLRSALRGLVVDRSGVRVHVRGGRAYDGTLERVGADFAELAVHPAGEARRRQAVREIAVVALSEIVAVRRRER